MRKYAIPKVAYVILVLMLACLSIGYTYAYFSATASAKSTPTLGYIGAVVWRDATSFGEMQGLFDAKPTDGSEDVVNEAMSIAIEGSLSRGNYTPIIATDLRGEKLTRMLEIYNKDSSIDVYCRIKITANYTPEGGTPEACDEWIQLAITSGTGKKLITENGWFYYKGYYYYGSPVKTGETITNGNLTAINANASQQVADYLHLVPNAPASMLGSTVTMTLTLEAVQTRNDAHITAWELDWIK